MTQPALIPFYRRTGFLIPGILVLAALIIAARFNPAAHPAEDAAMLMRYADHLAGGNGIVWNIGEKPVDGATDFLFMVMLAGLHGLGMPLETAVVGLGLTAHLATVALVFLTVARVERLNAWLAALSALLLALGPGIAYTNAYFGTTTFAFSAALTWHLAARLAHAPTPPRRLTLSFGAACLLCGLIRPEGVLLGAFILLGLLVRRRGSGARAILRDWALVFLGLGLIYFLWRWAYFSYPLPNPFYKKGAGLLHAEALEASLRGLFMLNQPYFWLLAGALATLLVRWLPSLRGSSFMLSLNLKKIRITLFALGGGGLLGVALGLTRRSQPQPGMLFERYSQNYFTLLMVGLAGALILLALALSLARWLPTHLRLPWFATRLQGSWLNWALSAGFILIPVLGFTLIWVLLSNEMNFLWRFQYALVPVILMGAPVVLAQALTDFIVPLQTKRLLRAAGAVLIMASLGFTALQATVPLYLDGRYDAAIFLRQFASKGYTIATSEAGLLPFYSTWRAVDTWGLNDPFITHTGEFTDSYLDRYHPELIVFHANLQFTEKPPVDAWDWMARRLWNYAQARGYTLAAAFGSQQDDYHYYYVRTDFADAGAIINYLKNMRYAWYEDGLTAVNHAPPVP